MTATDGARSRLEKDLTRRVGPWVVTRWLHSGLRRDICAVVASLDDPTGQTCKTTLEARYDDHVTPKTFYGAVEALVESGHLASEVDGIHDCYRLTPAGERALRVHYAWLTDCLDEH